MKLFMIFIVIAPGLCSQHKHSDTCSDHQESTYYRGDSSDTEQKLSSLELTNKEYLQKHWHSSSKTSKSKKYCKCDCQKCENLKTCCQAVCSNECNTEENTVESEPGKDKFGFGTGDTVVVPYPYPLVVPPPMPVMPPPPMPIMPPVQNATSEPKTNLCSKYSKCSIRKSFDLDDDPVSEHDPVLELLRRLRRRRDPQGGVRPVKGRTAEYEQMDEQLLDPLVRLRSVIDINSLV